MYGEDYKIYDVDTKFGKETIRFIVSKYMSGGEGLYVGVENFVDGEWEDYADITTNVERVPFMTLDVGHIDQEAADTYLAPVIRLMQNENLIERSHLAVQRDFKQYEMVHFPEEILTKGFIIDDELPKDVRLDGTYFNPDDDEWYISEELEKSINKAKRTEALKGMNEAVSGIEEKQVEAEDEKDDYPN